MQGSAGVTSGGGIPSNNFPLPPRKTNKEQVNLGDLARRFFGQLSEWKNTVL